MMADPFGKHQWPPAPFQPGDLVYTDNDYPRKLTRTVRKVTRILSREPEGWVPTYDIHLDGGPICPCCGHQAAYKTVALAKYCHLVGWDGS